MYWIIFPTTVHHADRLRYSRPKQQASEWCFGGKVEQQAAASWKTRYSGCRPGCGQSNCPSNKRKTSEYRREATSTD